jgi:hypothetical protein
MIPSHEIHVPLELKVFISLYGETGLQTHFRRINEKVAFVFFDKGFEERARIIAVH